MSLLLQEILEEYRLVRRIRASSLYQLERTIRLFGLYLCRSATLDDLVPGIVNRWLESLESTHAQRTVAGHRVNLLSVWRDAAERGLCPGPVRVRKVPKPHPNPTSWTEQEMERIVRVCAALSGTFENGVSRRTYILALANAAYDSGLRRSDLWTLRRSQIRPDGRISLIQTKTSLPHHPQLLPHTMDLIAALPGEVPLAFPGDERRFYELWSCVVRIADVRPGSLQQIRRTGATHVKRVTGSREAVRRYLGHATETMQDSYVDVTIAEPGGASMPPPLSATWWTS